MTQEEYKGFKILKTKFKPKGFIREYPYTFYFPSDAPLIKYAESLTEAKKEIDLFIGYGIDKAIRENKL